MFLANYSDGLTDVDLDDMVERFKESGKVACFLAVRPPLTYHLADIAADGRCGSSGPPTARRSGSTPATSCCARDLRLHERRGRLVVEPFQRLIEADQLMAYKHEGFFRSMDTLKDRQILEEMVEQGRCPGASATAPSQGAGCRSPRYEALNLAAPDARLSVLCLGAHSDDIEIGAGGTILSVGSHRGSGSKSIGAC